ncbi:metalloprotease [Candidatus Woesearchaeota archaeon]|nr:metalloprotease [Candidatus Woesearchaeota archaeon]
MRHANPGISFSAREQKDLLKAWVATSIAFAIFFSPMGSGMDAFMVLFVISAVTAGLGFLLHELAHKLVAYKFGVHGEFHSNDSMLVMSIIIAFFGMIIAAPGAVWLQGNVRKRESGIISVAGPATNVVLALAFLPLVFSEGVFAIVGQLGFFVNAILAAFNMIPIGGFDGAKVLRWSKPAYFSFLAVAVILLMYAYSVV